jgi:hypothetical protein
VLTRNEKGNIAEAAITFEAVKLGNWLLPATADPATRRVATWRCTSGSMRYEIANAPALTLRGTTSSGL